MSVELHPIQANAPHYSPSIQLYEDRVFNSRKACMFVACAAYCYPCLMGCDPYDKKDVIKVDIPRPPGHLDAEFKMRALGVVPTVTFPGGNIAPTGHSEMTKNDEGAGAQAVADGGADVLKAEFLSAEAEFFVSALSAGPVADSELDETHLERFNHSLFRESPPEYKARAIESACYYYHGFDRVFLEYTICLPLTLAQKYNWCGCGESLGDDAIKGFVSGFVESSVKLATGKPNDVARKFTGMAFNAGCWDGPALVNALAPEINIVVNKSWHNVQAKAYVRDDMAGDIAHMLINDPGFTPEINRDMLMKAKCVVMKTCIQNCNKSSLAWDSSGAKATADQIGSWIKGKLNISPSSVLSAASNML